MFNIGDKIVYPVYGAGIIESVEEKEILGEKKKYYILRIPIDDMRVMIPMDSMDDFRIRNVISYNEHYEVLDVFRQKTSDSLDNWSKRYRNNMDKIRSGNIYSIADVIKNLMIRDREKGLSPGEKKILENAKQILFSELIVVTGLKFYEIDRIIEDTLFGEDS
ncbi:RNA polymerase-binding transcription factor CarD [Oxobacter pfennigii]|uniref:RNA polymerase-binding transcription factor CarD n=1 Tax=Oxobacter pfennigii TaxID=36849 RepID=A0A0P8WK79_9CLOT|nr:CarD family transcriptional regulator [Oxobacter pfennigii]KPU42659.1 RNA polymerase-binding transcription factor CarD [Oxobacter pfennigii]